MPSDPSEHNGKSIWIDEIQYTIEEQDGSNLHVSDPDTGDKKSFNFTPEQVQGALNSPIPSLQTNSNNSDSSPAPSNTGSNSELVKNLNKTYKPSTSPSDTSESTNNKTGDIETMTGIPLSTNFNNAYDRDADGKYLFSKDFRDAATSAGHPEPSKENSQKKTDTDQSTSPTPTNAAAQPSETGQEPGPQTPQSPLPAQPQAPSEAQDQPSETPENSSQPESTPQNPLTNGTSPAPQQTTPSQPRPTPTPGQTNSPQTTANTPQTPLHNQPAPKTDLNNFNNWFRNKAGKGNQAPADNKEGKDLPGKAKSLLNPFKGKKGKSVGEKAKDVGTQAAKTGLKGGEELTKKTAKWFAEDFFIITAEIWVPIAIVSVIVILIIFFIVGSIGGGGGSGGPTTEQQKEIDASMLKGGMTPEQIDVIHALQEKNGGEKKPPAQSQLFPTQSQPDTPAPTPNPFYNGLPSDTPEESN